MPINQSLVRKLLLWLFSPMYAIADILKRRSKSGRRNFILKWHRSFCVFAALSFTWVLVAKSWFQSRSGPAIILGVTLAAVCWFRCNEILVAFVADVVEQLSEKTETRVFQPLERLRMLIESYLEVILYFAIIYALLPETWFLDSKLSNAGDALYFSAITITTVGYGDIVPLHTVARILAVQEALVGLSLIVLVIGVYISAAQGPTA